VTPTELLAFRERLGLSQAKLALALGVSANTLARWERGVLTIQHPRLIELALRQLEENPTRTP